MGTLFSTTYYLEKTNQKNQVNNCGKIIFISFIALTYLVPSGFLPQCGLFQGGFWLVSLSFIELWSPSLNCQVFCIAWWQNKGLARECHLLPQMARPGFVYQYEGGQDFIEYLLPLGEEKKKSCACLSCVARAECMAKFCWCSTAFLLLGIFKLALLLSLGHFKNPILFTSKNEKTNRVRIHWGWLT